MSNISIEAIAKVCHEANRAFCEVLGDSPQVRWEECPDWQRESAIRGVQYVLDYPYAPASAQHDAWMVDKIRDGWVYGEVKDPEKKTHPCLVPFENLPPEQQAKDYLFRAICKAFVDGGLNVR